jgi:succinyl-diaminopimelate desuccinylase
MLTGKVALDPVVLAQALIRCASVTPAEAGVLDALEAALTPLGFRCQRLPFARAGTVAVDNLYARIGTGGPHFCFAGHVDVVPPGDRSAWSVDPFAGAICHGRLYGRGAADMKGAIAAFVAAAAAFLSERAADVPGSLSLLITGDEEGDAINGTRPMLAQLAGEGERWDACLVGEPTCPTTLGEMIKIGRRGSLNARLRIEGTQGHAAYPERADNPIPRLVTLLARLIETPLDDGTPHFPPSTLTLTSVDVGNPVANVIPRAATARFNIRFNDCHSEASLRAWLQARTAEAGGRSQLEIDCAGEAFLCPPGRFTDLVATQVRRVTGQSPVLSTTGGTSDARFIKDYCPVVEFGLVGETAHQVDENVAVDDILTLSEVYRAILHAFFDRRGACPD